jgi:hypothetical protein
MATIITWKCTECGTEQQYAGADDLTLDALQDQNVTTNTMCKECGAPCVPVSVKKE